MTEAFSYGQVRRDLILPSGNQPLVERWEGRRGPSLARWVLGFEHRQLPLVTPEDVSDTLSRSTHGLGRLVKEVDTHNLIDDANPPWAMAYLFHRLVEQERQLPTWQDFYRAMTGYLADKWWDVIRDLARERGVDQAHALRAATWRLGTSWQSAMRTVQTLAVLRHQYGLPVRYHIFAHVVLRLEGWLPGPPARGYRLVMVNAFEDRKQHPATILRGKVAVHDMEVSGYGYGRVWMPSAVGLDRLARDLGWEGRAPVERQGQRALL